MKFLLNAASRLPEFRQLDEAVAGGALPAAVTGLATVHKAHFIAALCRNRQRRALVLAGDESEAQRLCGDLEAMGLRPLFLPLTATLPCATRRAPRTNTSASGQQVLALMAADAYDVARRPARTPRCSTPSRRRSCARRTVTLRPGQQITMEAAEAALLACGYERAVQVDGSGQFSRRGGILDVFPPDNAQPARLEFWGDEIDTISTFDVGDAAPRRPTGGAPDRPRRGSRWQTTPPVWPRRSASWPAPCAENRPRRRRKRCSARRTASSRGCASAAWISSSPCCTTRRPRSSTMQRTTSSF